MCLQEHSSAQIPDDAYDTFYDKLMQLGKLGRYMPSPCRQGGGQPAASAGAHRKELQRVQFIKQVFGIQDPPDIEDGTDIDFTAVLLPTIMITRTSALVDIMALTIARLRK